MRIRFIAISLLALTLILNPNPASSTKVFWLEDAMPTFVFGLERMVKKLDKHTEQTNDIVWDVAKVRIIEHAVIYDKKIFKIIVEAKAVGEERFNNKKSCALLISKGKRVIFGRNERKSLSAYFPNIDMDNLEYFVQFKAEVASYAVKNHNTGVVTFVDDYSEDIPEKAHISKQTICRNSLLSEDIYYE